MGEVIIFTTTGRSSRRRAEPGDGAQILLFTGVRYMRIDSVEPAEAERPTPRTPRSRRGGKRRA